MSSHVCWITNSGLLFPEPHWVYEVRRRVSRSTVDLRATGHAPALDPTQRPRTPGNPPAPTRGKPSTSSLYTHTSSSWHPRPRCRPRTPSARMLTWWPSCRRRQSRRALSSWPSVDKARPPALATTPRWRSWHTCDPSRSFVIFGQKEVSAVCDFYSSTTIYDCQKILS